jgi:hypothetical protein
VHELYNYYSTLPISYAIKINKIYPHRIKTDSSFLPKSKKIKFFANFFIPAFTSTYKQSLSFSVSSVVKNFESKAPLRPRVGASGARPPLMADG